MIVKTITGKIVTFAFDDGLGTATISDLKESIEESEEWPVEEQRLIFNGKQMEDGRMLLDYNVTSGSTVHLVMRSKGD